MPHTIDIQVASNGSPLPDLAKIEIWVAAALANLRENAELSIRIVDRGESRELNHRFRGKDKPTNVLSFPSDLPPELELPLLGDLLVCAPVVASEASEQNKSLESHWAHMIIHGTLHLLGYDHIEDEDAIKMEALETHIMLGLKFPAPYETSEPPNPHLKTTRSFSSP